MFNPSLRLSKHKILSYSGQVEGKNSVSPYSLGKLLQFAVESGMNNDKPLGPMPGEYPSISSIYRFTLNTNILPPANENEIIQSIGS